MATASQSNAPAPGDHAYVFDNAGEQAGARFDALSTLFDAGTRRHLEERGLSEGWQCLEVGAGGGSVAAWLCERVGPDGRVLATDIDTRFLETLRLPNLEVRRHDVVSDPLPEAAFDLVHARLVLGHLPKRDQALRRMATALKPGGWLVVEDFDSLSMPPDPCASPVEVRLRTGDVLRRVLAERGFALQYGRLLPGLLRAQGLVAVGAEARVYMWQGGSAGASLHKANYEQLRGEIISSGLVSEREFERDLARLAEEDFLAPSPLIWAAWGFRPRN